MAGAYVEVVAGDRAHFLLGSSQVGHATPSTCPSARREGGREGRLYRLFSAKKGSLRSDDPFSQGGSLCGASMMIIKLYNFLFKSSTPKEAGEEGPLPRQPVNKGDSMQIKRLLDEVATQVITETGGYPEDHTAGNFKICTQPAALKGL